MNWRTWMQLQGSWVCIPHSFNNIVLLEYHHLAIWVNYKYKICTLKKFVDFSKLFYSVTRVIISNKRMNSFILFCLIKANTPEDALSLLLLDGIILKFETYVKTLISKNKNSIQQQQTTCQGSFDLCNFSSLESLFT